MLVGSDCLDVDRGWLNEWGPFYPYFQVCTLSSLMIEITGTFTFVDCNTLQGVSQNMRHCVVTYAYDL